MGALAGLEENFDFNIETPDSVSMTAIAAPSNELSIHLTQPSWMASDCQKSVLFLTGLGKAEIQASSFVEFLNRA